MKPIEQVRERIQRSRLTHDDEESDYEVYTRGKSRIDPSKTVSVFDHRRCPRCTEKFTEELKHLEPFRCGACDLVMTMKGSILECEAEVEE